MSDLAVVLPGSAASRLAREIITPQEKAKDDRNIQRRQAVVTAVNGSPPTSVDVQLGGSGITVPGVKYVQDYRPVVGDVVWVDLKGTDPLVTGSNTKQPWTTYTPSVLNNGQAAVTKTVEYASYYYANGLVHAQCRLAITSNSAGIGILLVGLPFTLAGAGNGSVRGIGIMHFFDVSANLASVGMAISFTTTAVGLIPDGAVGNNSVTTALGTGDVVWMHVAYDPA